MRVLLRSSLCALALSVALPAWAVDDGTKEAPPVSESEGSTTYSAGGLAKVNTKNFRLDSNSQLKLDDAINLDVTIGFRIPTVPSFGIELELSTTVIPGQITQEDCSALGGGGGGLPIGGGGGGSSGTSCSDTDQGDFGVNSAAVYGVYRSPGRFYGMGKVGYGYIASNINGLPEKRNSSSYGLGFGYRWNPRKQNGVELFYSKVADTIHYEGFSFSYGFGGRD